MNEFADDVRKKIMKELRSRCKISESDLLIRKSGIVRQDLYVCSFNKGLKDFNNSVSRIEKSKFKKQEVEDLQNEDDDDEQSKQLQYLAMMQNSLIKKVCSIICTQEILLVDD